MTTTSPSTHSMLSVHQSAAPWLTPLGPGEVLSLPAQGGPRWLRVETGCLWVTAAQQPAPCVPAEADIWLQAGECLALAAHSAWVVQAWPSAQVLIAQAAPTPLPQPPTAGGRYGLFRVLLKVLCRHLPQLGTQRTLQAL